MPEGGFYQRRRPSPTAITIVVLLHGAAITALALSKMNVAVFVPPKPTEIFEVLPAPEPPPVPEPPKEEAKQQPMQREQVTYQEPIVKSPVRSAIEIPAVPTFDPPRIDVDPGPVTLDLPPAPKALPPEPKAPVKVDAKIDARSDLQPPYPPSEERMGNEGSVTVRITVGADGRVKSVEKVRAASDAFYRATERHALRNWRFKPATVDAKPVESRTTMTVHFQIRN